MELELHQDEEEEAPLQNDPELRVGSSGYSETETDRDVLKKHIKEWVQCDSEINELEKQIRRKKKEKKTISGHLIKIMSQNEIDCFDIQNGSQKILYSKKEVKKPLTKKKLQEIFSKYFQGDSEQVLDIQNYIFENRDVVFRESILRKKNSS